MSWHGGWQAQHSSSGARATSLEAAVAPIHHRRESACSLDVGLVPAALQRVVGLTSRLVRSLGSGEIEGSRGSPRAADGLSRRHWYRGAGLRRIDAFSQFTATYAWTPPGIKRASRCNYLRGQLIYEAREPRIPRELVSPQRYHTSDRDHFTKGQAGLHRMLGSHADRALLSSFCSFVTLR